MIFNMVDFKYVIIEKVRLMPLLFDPDNDDYKKQGTCPLAEAGPNLFRRTCPQDRRQRPSRAHVLPCMTCRARIAYSVYRLPNTV